MDATVWGSVCALVSAGTGCEGSGGSWADGSGGRIPSFSATSARAASASVALAYLLSGCFSVRRMTTASSEAGTTAPDAALAIGGVGVLICCLMILTGSVSLKGLSPVSISYRMSPSAYRSVRASTGAPTHCSGAI